LSTSRLHNALILCLFVSTSAQAIGPLCRLDLRKLFAKSDTSTTQPAVGKWQPLSAGEKGQDFTGEFFLDGHGHVYVTSRDPRFIEDKSALDRAKDSLQSRFSGIDVLPLPYLTFQGMKALLNAPKELQGLGFFQYPEYHAKVGGVFDPDGDLHLIRRWENYFKRMKVLQEKDNYTKMSQARHDAQDPRKNGAKIGKQPPILMDRFLSKVQKTIQEFPQFKPRFGPAPQWSPAARDYLKRRLFHIPLPSKLFVSLLPGIVSQYANTGHEAELEAYLKSRPDSSVLPDELFREAYRLSEGDLTMTLVLAENLLARNAERPDREELNPILKKLAYLRNDSAPLFDNFGFWYHLFGMALYTSQHSYPMSRFVAEVEILGSISNPPRDRQEELSDRLGVALGQGLKKIASGRAPYSPGAPTDYLSLNEFPPAASEPAPSR
jgi:hypothetical protein